MEHEGRRWLVTNRHVVRARNNENDELLDKEDDATPSQVRIFHHGQVMGNWVDKVEPLYKDPENRTDALWFEHPDHGGEVAVIALPLTDLLEDVTPNYYDPWAPDHFCSPEDERELMPIQAGADVSVVGFPYGESGGGKLPIWIRGTLATEPQINLYGLPLMLIDARTRPSQSGSPVVAFRGAASWTMAKTGVYVIHADLIRFIGVYSSRTGADTDLGHVWKAEAVCDIIANGQPGEA